MKIRLRVAGIYFNRHLLVPPNVDGSPITIKNAMDYCASEYRIEKVNGFAYKDESMPRPDGKRFQVVHSISHFFSGAYDFNGDGKITAAKDNKGKTLGGVQRDGGLYSLKSTEIQQMPNIRSVWQYYVRGLDGQGVLRSRTKPDDGGFASYDTFELEEEDEVIWRLVTIQFEPTVELEQVTPKLALQVARY